MERRGRLDRHTDSSVSADKFNISIARDQVGFPRSSLTYWSLVFPILTVLKSQLSVSYGSGRMATSSIVVVVKRFQLAIHVCGQDILASTG